MQNTDPLADSDDEGLDEHARLDYRERFSTSVFFLLSDQYGYARAPLARFGLDQAATSTSLRLLWVMFC